MRTPLWLTISLVSVASVLFGYGQVQAHRLRTRVKWLEDHVVIKDHPLTITWPEAVAFHKAGEDK